ncbi:MAG: hypothetical protein NC115_11940 [Bacteroidales bacterium]|nr:hypothetical protein [Bacteroidales bacterium]
MEYDEAGGKFILELKDGKTIVIPVATNFLCTIEAEGEQAFDYGQTRSWMVRMEGVSQAIVIAPDGWACVLDGNVLSVTAPEAMTKAVVADNTRDVCIIAFSLTGFTAVAKMPVVIEGASARKPAIVATLGDVTVSTASVSVVTANASSWKYMLKKASETAPSAVELLSGGIDGEGNSLVLSELEDGTDYKAWFIAAGEEGFSDVAELAFTTESLPVTSWYDVWESGRAITIDGVKYSKDTYGASGVTMHITEDYTFTEPGEGVYFVDPGVTFTIKPSKSVSKLIIVGNDPAQRSNVVFGGQMQFYEMGSSEGTNVCAFYNVNVDALTIGNYVMKVNNARYFDRLVFDNCSIRPYTTLIYSKDSDRGFKYFAVVNSEIEITRDNTQFVNAQPGTSNWGTVKYDNNIWYSQQKRINFYLFQGTNGSSNLAVDNFVITGNTLFNLHSKTDFYCNVGTCRNAVVSGNLCFFEDALVDAEGFLRCRVEYPSAGTVDSNVYYTETASSKSFQVFFGGIANGFAGSDEAVKLDESPFVSYDASKCSFVKKDIYAGFGARR